MRRRIASSLAELRATIETDEALNVMAPGSASAVETFTTKDAEPQENNGFKEIRWMWEDRGWWCFYHDSEIQQIEEAFLRDDPYLSIKNVAGNFTIDFKSMTQSGKYQRRVLRLVIL